MRQGVVAIVRKVGWYDELQDDVVVKVESPEAVLTALRGLVADKKKLRTIGAKAKAYVTEHFSAEQYAQAMLDMLAKDQSNNPNAATAAALKAGKIKNATSLIAFLKKKGAV
jgi:glycosyltransferase involved in cell wall biosynthesis